MLPSRALLPALAGIAGRPLTVTAFRAVPLQPFVAYVQREGRPNLRFMSGARNRYNLAGTACLYVAEEDETARVELRHGFDGVPVDEAIFHVKCELTRVLDLMDANVRAALGMTDKNLFAPWETAKRPTATQRLGEAVLRGGRFDAIRFPSNAMRAISKTGVNLVITEAAALDPAKVTVANYDDPKA
jgi:RES domain-containing protein